jgi:Fur family transcriptional regulator, ferric uptake regulator
MERFTRQRTAIAAAMAGADRPLSPQEVLELAQASVQGLGIATVYRNLKVLLEDDVIRVVHLPGESPRYEAVGHGHHHHFQCTACTRVFDVHDCPGDLRGLAPRGFVVESHELTLYGRCSDCAPRARAVSRQAGTRQAAAR